MLNSGGGNEVMKLTVKKNDLRGHFSKDFSCESVCARELVSMSCNSKHCSSFLFEACIRLTFQSVVAVYI